MCITHHVNEQKRHLHGIAAQMPSNYISCRLASGKTAPMVSFLFSRNASEQPPHKV